MKIKIINIVFILSCVSLFCFYMYIGHMCIKSESEHRQEIDRREYIKFQRDSIELEILKQHGK